MDIYYNVLFTNYGFENIKYIKEIDVNKSRIQKHLKFNLSIHKKIPRS